MPRLNEVVMVCGYDGLICIFDQHDKKHSNLDTINHLGGLDAQIRIIIIQIIIFGDGGRAVAKNPRRQTLWKGGRL